MDELNFRPGNPFHRRMSLSRVREDLTQDPANLQIPMKFTPFEAQPKQIVVIPPPRLRKRKRTLPFPVVQRRTPLKSRIRKVVFSSSKGQPPGKRRRIDPDLDPKPNKALEKLLSLDKVFESLDKVEKANLAPALSIFPDQKQALITAKESLSGTSPHPDDAELFKALRELKAAKYVASFEDYAKYESAMLQVARELNMRLLSRALAKMANQMAKQPQIKDQIRTTVDTKDILNTVSTMDRSRLLSMSEVELAQKEMRQSLGPVVMFPLQVKREGEGDQAEGEQGEAEREEEKQATAPPFDVNQDPTNVLKPGDQWGGLSDKNPNNPITLEIYDVRDGMVTYRTSGPPWMRETVTIEGDMIDRPYYEKTVNLKTFMENLDYGRKEWALKRDPGQNDRPRIPAPK